MNKNKQQNNITAEEHKINGINDLKNNLWNAADALRGNLSAEQYMHIVIGIIFLKHMSDVYDKAIFKMKEQKDEKYVSYYFKNRDVLGEYGASFIVPEKASWKEVAKYASQEIIGEKLDKAFEDIEKENDNLKGLFDKNYNRKELDQRKLGMVVTEFTDLNMAEYGEDIIGRTYEYFLGQFFKKLGQKGGEFYTPKSIVNLIVNILKPKPNDLIYDPACGTGGMFVQAKNYLEEHQNSWKDLVLFGQESQTQTWKLAKINLLLNHFPIGNIKLGAHEACTFVNDQHPNEKFDIIMANPPFNLKDWGHDLLEKDQRWKWGFPQKGNANYAWLSHIAYKLKEEGKAGVVLANNTLSSSNKNDKDIRAKFIEENKIDLIVSLPDKLFYTVTLSASVWFFNNNKNYNKVLMIDISEKGQLINKKLRELTDEELNEVINVYNRFSNGEDINIPGFAKSVTIEEIKKLDYTLVPSRYIDIKEEKFSEEETIKEINNLSEELKKLFQELKDNLPKAEASLEKILKYKIDLENKEN